MEFDITQHLLDDNGQPVVTKAGKYHKLGLRKKNDPDAVAKYMAASMSRPAQRFDNTPKKAVVDKSMADEWKNPHGMQEFTKDRISEVVKTVEEVQQEAEKNGELVNYSFYDRKVGSIVTSNYNINSLMNELFDVALKTGGRVDLINDRADPDVRTIEARNSFGGAVSLNIKQPPAKIKVAILNCLTNVRKPMVSEKDGQYVQEGYAMDAVEA